MVAAHEGVPVAQLPGAWHTGDRHSDDGGQVAQRPSAPLAKAPVEQSPVEQSPVSQRVENAGFGAQQQEAPTSSVRRIVPPGDVGAPAPRRTNSILDILTGG